MSFEFTRLSARDKGIQVCAFIAEQESRLKYLRDRNLEKLARPPVIPDPEYYSFDNEFGFAYRPPF